MGLLINIDNGGTFTDACVSHGERLVWVKALTTPHDLTRCFQDVLERAATELYGEEASLARLLAETDHLRYSTTSTTNAVVEHTGAPVGLIVEAGEEEALYGAAELAAGDGALWAEMVPHRPLGIPVAGAEGIDPERVTEVVNALVSLGVHRLVVAVRDPRVEGEVKAILLDRYPRHLLGAIPVLFSHELVRDADAARRTVTAVVNSYLHPGLEHFLYSAEQVVRARHLRSPLLIFRNDGDSARVAKTVALKTYGSGPRGGVEGAMAYARHYDLSCVVTLDVGGTTTDLSVVREHVATPLRYGRAGALPLSFPAADVESMGIGGSSVFRVAEGAIRIGPDSVGAAPGPACFGRGGGEATMTDALLAAGLLDPRDYLGGEIQLDAERARAAIEQHVAKPLGVEGGEAVRRMWAEYEEAIAGRVRAALGAQGVAPEGAVLLAFGGAGPMSACGVAENAGIGRVLIPQLSSVFSAFGISFSDLGHRYRVPLGDAEAEGFESAAAALRRRAERDMYGEGVEPQRCAFELALAGAREGRERVHPVAAGTFGELRGAAEREELADPELELRALYPLPHLNLAAADDGGTPQTPQASGRRGVDLEAGDRLEVETFVLADLAPGASAAGPALVCDTYLTAFIRPGWRFRVTGNGDLLVEAH